MATRPVRGCAEQLEERLLLSGVPFAVDPLDAAGAGETLIQQLLAENSNITVEPSSVVYIGANHQAGTFEVIDLQDPDSGQSLSLGKGILLTNGDAGLASTSNAPPSEGSPVPQVGEDLDNAGDSDLSALIGENTNDANVLEFDF